MAADSSKIKNIGILAHVDAGKTTLTEQMLYACGAIRKAGSVDEGTAQTDWLDIERQRGISVRAAQASLSWQGYTVNLLDTPGHLDFAGEVERSLAALDGAVLVVSAVEGIQSHTENLWNALTSSRLPRILFINKLDRTGSRSAEILSEFRARLGGYFLPLNVVLREGERDCAVEEDAALSERLAEAAAEFDDGIAERWLEGEEIPGEELCRAVAEAVASGLITPVVFGCARQGLGVETLMNAVTSCLPSASENIQEGLSALIFKIEHDKTMGKIAHVRLYGGALKSRDTVALQNDEPRNGDEERPQEKIAQIRKFNGQKYVDVGEVSAGDIAALCGLSGARVGDYLGERRPGGLYSLANPFFRVKAQPRDPAKLTALVTALRELSDEEPLVNCRWEKSEREIDINITGEIQLEVIASLLKERYDLTADFSPPTVIYKETPIEPAFGFEAYTMPKPCWAIVRFFMEPLPRGSGVQYDGGRVPHDQLFYKYQEHIRTCFRTCLEQGPRGWEVTDFRCTLVDGGHHTIHTHPLDFFVATPMAFQDGLVNAGTKLLEPFIRVRISAPEDAMGKVIGDITGMRGEFDVPVITGGMFHLECSLPVATSLDYPVRLASLTGGRSTFFSRFDGYRDCPEGLGQNAPYRGVYPLDKSKWILYKRGAYTE
ncbi:MAG: TetM/TetW/TetO/TetS family tetracycline resistance ribosomal protection protein [Ruminococcaceae bacterium]|nr:TetM/TetW/TetO/TetS family tetracycline resistance ribosomal protection protein [Oscillospiraceae bacterium]